MAQNPFNYDSFKRLERSKRGHRFRGYPQRRAHRYEHLLADPSRLATTKREKNFIRRYSRTLRKKLHARDHWACFGCGTKERFLHIHHVRYTTNMADWVSVCKRCHDTIHHHDVEIADLCSQDLPVQDILILLREILHRVEKSIPGPSHNPSPHSVQNECGQTHRQSAP